MSKERNKELSEKEITKEFVRRRKRLMVIAIIFGVTISAVVLGALQGWMPNAATATVLIISFLWAFIANMRMWRCPSCNGHLGKLYLGINLPKYCPHCGIKLIE